MHLKMLELSIDVLWTSVVSLYEINFKITAEYEYTNVFETLKIKDR